MPMQILLEKAYTEISENIKFLEAKNAALVTLDSALLAILGTLIFNQDVLFFYRWLIALFAIYLLGPLTLALVSFRTKDFLGKVEKKGVLQKRINKSGIAKTPSKLLYYAYIFKYYANAPAELLADISNQKGVEATQVEHQLASQVVDLSAVAYRKAELFNIAITWQCIGFIVGGLVAFCIVLYKVIG